MSKSTWILLYKKFLEWEWYDNPPTKDVYLHCLICANYKNEKWKGVVIKRGQFPTSIEKLSAALGLSTQQVRTAIKNLQMTNDINIQTTSRYSVITVLKYDLYQPPNKQITKYMGAPNKQITNKQHAEIPVNSGKNQVENEASNKQSGGENNNTLNNNNKERYNKLYLSSSCSEEKNSKIDDDEREILKNYVKRNHLANKNLRGYVKKIIDNGDYLDILKDEKKRLAKIARQKQKENSAAQNFEKIESSLETDKQGLELMRNTVRKIRKMKEKIEDG